MKTDSGSTVRQDVPSRSVDALRTALAQQPVSVAIEANLPAFQMYKSGILHPHGTCGAKLDHGVLAVGYHIGEDFWIVKASRTERSIGRCVTDSWPLSLSELVGRGMG